MSWRLRINSAVSTFYFLALSNIAQLVLRFDSVEDAREHCLSAACKDQDGFLEMKARHDEAQKRRDEHQNKYTNEETGHSPVCAETRKAHLQYFGSLTRQDLLLLADKFNVSGSACFVPS